jgi:hypothetical protein
MRVVEHFSGSFEGSLLVLLPLLGIGGQVPPMMGQSGGTFSTTGNLTTARRSHTATLLANGKVLVAGGSDYTPTSWSVLASAELYDPVSGTFTPTGNMTTARQFHTATMLPNGKIMIAGGASGESTLATTELYDPSTGAFTATGEMTTPRQFHSSVLLNNGNVLIAGGSYLDASHVYNGLGSAELYDSSTGTFTATGRMTAIASGAHIAILLPNGNAFVAGSGSGAAARAELCDPNTGTFTPIEWQDAAFPAATVNLLPSEKVLVTRNIEGCDFGLRRADLWDPSTGRLALTGNMA